MHLWVLFKKMPLRVKIFHAIAIAVVASLAIGPAAAKTQAPECVVLLHGLARGANGKIHAQACPTP